MLVCNLLANNSTKLVPQAPFSPHQTSCDFFLFSRFEQPLRGCRFESIEVIKQNSLNELKAISETEFHRCFEEVKKRWLKCIVSNWDYFEGNRMEIDE
ncbi:hypothetical protein WH47_07471 [Habropoda laboriosa]|uniref:Histone-lysine N-methyltransferase SETMAR n=1 Tax=Habropoda laboriosa TaxID=597456 RepID=A0A0L7QPA0_9HYME|nr:hypothetical protein WH47_07471 [Habropoda laboriosa]